jgi:hypothetical protein
MESSLYSLVIWIFLALFTAFFLIWPFLNDMEKKD